MKIPTNPKNSNSNPGLIFEFIGIPYISRLHIEMKRWARSGLDLLNKVNEIG